MKNEIFYVEDNDGDDGDEVKYSGRQSGLGYDGNSKGRACRNEEKSWSESDIKQTGLTSRVPL